MSSTTIEHGSWTAAGADTAAQNTYAAVRRALAEVERQRKVEIFLQGSYANQTNIRADSDVDVVVMTRLVFRGSVERLSANARARYSALPPAEYQAPNLRAEVIAALNNYFGESRVHPRNKCIKVDKRDGYVDADVVPAIEYHHYTDPDDLSKYIEGIAILPRDGGVIVNFPKEHIKNGQAKNAACNGRYKETVRQMKHLRNRAEREGLLPADIAPGYLLECMTFNAPPDRFVPNDSERLKNVVLWLKYADKSTFWACDKVHRLFKDDPGKFNVNTAQRIIDALWEAY